MIAAGIVDGQLLTAAPAADRPNHPAYSIAFKFFTDNEFAACGNLAQRHAGQNHSARTLVDLVRL